MNDMNHYKRHLPPERPITMETIIFKVKGSGIAMGYADDDESGESPSYSFCSGDDYWWPKDVDWWAYAYIPTEDSCLNRAKRKLAE